MRKMLTAATAAGLVSLAACTGATNDVAPDNAAETSEVNADYYQRTADAIANAAVANLADAANAAEANSDEATQNGL